MRWCFDRRVLIGLGVVVAGVLLVRPSWFAIALPVLVLAMCPLSMLLMMRGMERRDTPAQTDTTAGRTGEQHKAMLGRAYRDAEVGRLREEINILRAELYLRDQRDQQQAHEQR
jgi:uncharacterized protein YdbL (DUF1318 family)